MQLAEEVAVLLIQQLVYFINNESRQTCKLEACSACKMVEQPGRCTTQDDNSGRVSQDVASHILESRAFPLAKECCTSSAD